MAENNGISSGESEPEEVEDLESEENIDFDIENVYEGREIFEDSNFHPSIKNFEGNSEINPDISITGNRPIDYFNYFCDTALIDRIIQETNRYKMQSQDIPSDHMLSWSPLTKNELEYFLVFLF
ncbi:hypothetical protein ABEB36_005648 [Hypothenemus hampei]|uniref:PiggyBac transposable element-derived protein domain-containing protein n=1 Tax=Hypothenemus hampei TaxID=57062 RepID=A0ABD1E3R0_HYPHA